MEYAVALEQYLVWHEVSGHSLKTIGWYKWTLGTFGRWLVETGRSTKIENISILDARAFLQSEGQRETLCPNHPTGVERPGKLSDRTLHCYARCIRAWFNWMAAEELIDKNPMSKLKPPKLAKRFKEVLSTTEVERLLAELNPRTYIGARLYAIVAVLYDCGLRAGEVANLDLHDVHWTEYNLKVMGKGKKERIVPFSPATHRALRKYLTLREQYVQDEPDALFLTVEGRRMTRESITQAIKRLGERAGIPRLHPHLLRHSAAVAYLMNGGDQFGLKRLLGHEDLGTTDVYVDYTQQHLATQHRKVSPMSRVNEARPRSSTQGSRVNCRSSVQFHDPAPWQHPKPFHIIRTQHRLKAEPEMLRSPSHQLATIRAINAHLPQLLACSSQARNELPCTRWVRHRGCRHHHRQHQSQRIHEQMALAPAHQLAVAKASLVGEVGGLDTLAVQAARSWMLMMSRLPTNLRPKPVMDPLPGAIIAPFGVVEVNALPFGILTREHAPLAAADDDVEDGIEHRAHL